MIGKMRIIGGQWRRQALATPENAAQNLPASITGNSPIRPTSDRAREGVFNVLQHRYEAITAETVVLDLCCGTGAMGLEALSRGAKYATFMDNNTAALKLVEQSARKFDALEKVSIKKQNILQLAPALQPYDIIFCDPPYAEAALFFSALQQLAELGYAQQQTIIALELPVAIDFPTITAFTLDVEKKYGAAKVGFYCYSA